MLHKSFYHSIILVDRHSGFIKERDIISMDKNTKMFDSFKTQKTNKQIVKEVYQCLQEKDYNPIDQLVGYIISGDPSYITSFNNARTLIKSVDRDELVAEMLKAYIDV